MRTQKWTTLGIPDSLKHKLEKKARERRMDTGENISASQIAREIMENYFIAEEQEKAEKDY